MCQIFTYIQQTEPEMIVCFPSENCFLSPADKKIEIKFLPKAGMLRTFNLADRISISNPLLLPWLLKCISSQSLAAFGVILKYT